jgi:hypothetical protein
VAVVLLFIAGMYLSPFEPHPPPVGPTGAPIGAISWDDGDWDVLSSALRSAKAAGLEELPMGTLMAEVGKGFVGTAYVPGTLEVEGPERLVINLRGMDCVTFVENVYATAALVKSGAVDRIDDRAAVEAEYERMLRTLRYRNGFIDGYASRLHYFSDWIADGERKLVVEDVTEQMGGEADPAPIDFMSSHPEAYRQLAEPESLDEVLQTEARLTARGRVYLPQDRIREVEDEIREGDIIAATSTVPGLDVAHTGIAVRIDGSLRLLHAPLVGEAVQISERSLSERILAMDGQDGIMVARPLEPLAARTRAGEPGASSPRP